MVPSTKTKTGSSVLIMVAFIFLSASAAQGAPARSNVVVKQETTDQQIVDLETFPEQENSLSSTAISNGKRETVDVPVISWRDMPFQTVKKQALDYSCGSAAVSTLLTYVYGKKTSEGSVFKTMFEAGNKDKIRQEGFSLLDMSRYLSSLGFKAVGYKADLATIEKNRVPFIALINDNGYNHFVVVKSVKGPHLLIGDPNKGNVIYPRTAFEKAWNGISLVITNRAKTANGFFEDEREWRYAHRLADPNGADYPGIDSTTLSPLQWQVAPAHNDLLSAVNVTTANIVQQLAPGALSGAGVIP